MPDFSQYNPDEPIDVLLIEDNPGDVRLTREAFETTAVETTLHVVTDGDAAVDFLKRENEHETAPVPDLVLLDLNLPGRDGSDVLETIADERRLRRLPVIVLTSSAASEDIARSYGSHANAYLTKPADLAAFVETVEAVERFWFEHARLPPISP